MTVSFRVVWRHRLIEHDLAQFVFSVMQRDEGLADITQAMNEIDRLLAANPQGEGESRDEFERILIVPPLAVDYEVYEDEHVGYVLRARYLRAAPLTSKLGKALSRINMNPPDELVDIIDAEGRTIAVVTRREMRLRCLPHRCVYLLVFNTRGELFIHLRTATKDVFPSHWDVVIGGVLAAGEDFDAGVVREAREELGVALKPEPIFLFRYADAATLVQGMVYQTTHDGPFCLQPEEIVRGDFVPLVEIARRRELERFCPDGLAVLEQYQQQIEKAGA